MIASGRRGLEPTSSSSVALVDFVEGKDKSMNWVWTLLTKGAESSGQEMDAVTAYIVYVSYVHIDMRANVPL